MSVTDTLLWAFAVIVLAASNVALTVLNTRCVRKIRELRRELADQRARKL